MTVYDHGMLCWIINMRDGLAHARRFGIHVAKTELNSKSYLEDVKCVKVVVEINKRNLVTLKLN